jgi:uncharacterized cupredoxin-like copper-binding protein
MPSINDTYRVQRALRKAAAYTVFGFAILTGAFVATRIAGATETAEALQQLTVETTDYAFDMPAVLRPGLTQIRLVNKGKEEHHVWIVRLEQGKTLADLFAAMQSGNMSPEWAKSMGGPNAHVPGAQATALMKLEAGRYAALCFIPAPDGKPHIMKGMAKEFEVKGEPVRAAEPAPDIEATLSDYDFTFSKPIAAGRQAIRFRNTSGQVHEAFIAKLGPGVQAADFLKWAAKPDGPPPITPMGGITGITPGESLTLVEEFTPGTYALYCFVPDAKDGREHVAHGMMKQFTVQ